jgi:deoxyribodipyrimidine photo-lyase
LQAKTYDPDGEYAAYWLPELRSLAKERRNFPGASYIKQIVPLKFDGASQKRDQQFNRQTRPKNVYRRQK